MKLIFWQNILSPHQASFLRALADGSHDVVIVSSEAMNAGRRAMGWAVPDMGRARLVLAPADEQVRELIEGGGLETIHVMAGARWSDLGNLAVKLCRVPGRRLGILSESADPRGLLGYGRWLRYAFEHYTTGARYDFVLAMGELGVAWFRRAGFADKTIFPFAYVTDPIPPAPASPPAADFSILYSGQFIPRKGLDVLLRAFARLRTTRPVQLRLLGDGAQRSQLEKIAGRLGIAGRIVWLPRRKAAEVQLEMAKADVTVLPSRHDGWGAVVNESLMMGTPVICSDACGAFKLVEKPWRGSVVRAGDVEDLATALDSWIERGSRTPAERERIREWSACISGEAVAKYFAEIMAHVYEQAPRPVAPWRL